MAAGTRYPPELLSIEHPPPDKNKRLAPEGEYHRATWRPRGASARDKIEAKQKPAPLVEPTPPGVPPLDPAEGRKLIGQKKEALAGLLPAALLRLAAELRGDFGVEVAHDAAKYVVDQAIGKATQASTLKAEVDSGEGADLLAALRMADAKAAEFAAAQRGKVVEAEVKELPSG